MDENKDVGFCVLVASSAVVYGSCILPMYIHVMKKSVVKQKRILLLYLNI